MFQLKNDLTHTVTHTPKEAEGTGEKGFAFTPVLFLVFTRPVP